MEKSGGPERMIWRVCIFFLLIVMANFPANAQGKKPNIVVFWGDDIGQSNISAYTKGVMGYHTPNIDRIAKEGMMFTDYYAEQSCTAGRASFITGQSGLRTGMTKVGVPASPLGLRKEDPTVAEMLKPLGYATGQFGKIGRQVCKDTGPLTRKRMETIDDDIVARAVDFIQRQHQAGKPFFIWINTTHMHLRTHTKPESVGQSGRWQSSYHDTMIDHDGNVGAVLKALDDLGIANDTFFFYGTDNGPHMNSWPDGAMTPFRNEKNSNW